MPSHDVPDEGPETGDESDEDMIRDYLPPDPHEIPAINITLHSPNTNHVLGELRVYVTPCIP